ncbi:MBL fold metallo-hydrolase [Pseudohalioglobus sediminis]|uniref:MBL fold metallo-hydrolase n=1 Tax=Pseudohalioglobus sediminis TaxID=2606449 RepID=A0A5B0WRG3_9GAMM|nr:MBL fold metallo-hydrolase [Pseudohalioglobus sediminis]KAA1189642.1 MBL fold metallo-hydrolase [Pseudohalioglobus sediminis]
MTTTYRNPFFSGGRARVVLLVLLAALSLGALWLYLDEEAGSGIKKTAQLAALDAIGDAATRRLGGEMNDDATHGSAVELIRRPVEVRKLSDNVYMATGVGNVIMVTTSAGNVVFDTGLVLQTPKQLAALQAVSDAPVHTIVLSHSHADHTGGTRFFADAQTRIITHEAFVEEQRYLSELEPYQYGRNRTLFPWMPAWEDRPDIAMMRYGGIEPTLTVGDWEKFAFSLGGVEFEVFGTPGAEGADNLVMWLPQQKMLLSGDFFGPQFPQFPNIFTMRGEKVRKPIEYVKSLDFLLPLGIETVVPSHLDPTSGAETIASDMQRIRDAVQYVHDQTVAGMNAGKTVYQLMREIALPPELELVQNHGKVDWAVRSIWDYYMTWFHFDSTTELYPVPAREIYADLARLAGNDGLRELAEGYLAAGEAVRSLHVIEVMLAAEPADAGALALRQSALATLLEAAEGGLRNDYEIYWLQSRMADTAARLESPEVQH